MTYNKFMKNIRNFSINKKGNNFWKFVVGIITLVVLLYVLNIFVLPIKNGFYYITSPLQKSFWTAGKSSSFFLASLVNGGDVSKENENLKEENKKLLLQVALLQSVEQVSQAQSEVFAACQDNNFKLVMARVNGLDNDILSIDKGSNEGISEGMPVINQQKVLIGKVFKVYSKFSQIMLVSNKNSTIVAKIQQADSLANEINGVVKGNGGLGVYLDSVLINNNINVGDILMTSATDPLFPKDLLIGKIVKVEKNDQESFQQAKVELFFDLNIDNLFVIANYKQTN